MQAAIKTKGEFDHAIFIEPLALYFAGCWDHYSGNSYAKQIQGRSKVKNELKICHTLPMLQTPKMGILKSDRADKE